ncbi:hypothetical protein PoHVEF18_003145 [Penicillium ochrochloron]
MDNFNNNTWGWYGCDELQTGQVICLSNGTAPYPVAIANAVCGPQVPGANFTGTGGAADWAALNPSSQRVFGAPGTAPAGSNGCIFTCGTDIVNNATAPTAYSAVGYFEAYNGDRSFLTMDTISIDPTNYTHVHFAFANITSNFSISLASQEQQFEYFKELAGMKRIVSFGGWDFSTNIDTYMIFREGVAAANRDTLVNNLVEFVISNALDGVDFDWEYPGEPDIPGIPAGSDEDGSNYLAFLQALRTALPDNIPIAAIAEVVDHIFYMTYDLHGTWDLGNEWAQNGCSAGDCLFSHVNLTETMWALSMITKAPVATSSIMVGVTSYGRSFEMTPVGCYTSDCTWDAAGAAGPCTDTAGYISNAEINQILADDSDAQQIFSSNDDSDILVYNETQWVAYMTNTTKSTRTAYYQTFNFAGTSEWAVDLEEYQLFSYTDGTDTGLELLELSAYSDSLNLDVNYNLSCINLRRGDNTSAQLEEYVVLGALKIDAILYEYKGKTNTKTRALAEVKRFALRTGLGIAASVAPEDDGVVGAFSTSVSNIESIVGLLSISSTFTLPDESDLETALENILSQLVEATTTAITNLTIAIFEKPNQAKPLPGSLIDGPFMYPVSNYFYNSKILFGMDSDTWTNTVDKFNGTIKKHMVGAALGDADYYILRDSSTAETDCTETAKYYIDGSCYTLAYPGASECIAGIGTQALATEDTITSITSYDIDMEELITNSYTCQNTTNMYFGSLDVDVADLAQDGTTLPTCFFNLPVFDLVSTTSFLHHTF